jgi:hypothetical protein
MSLAAIARMFFTRRAPDLDGAAADVAHEHLFERHLAREVLDLILDRRRAVA